MTNPIDYIADTGGRMVVCPKTNTPCWPLCPAFTLSGKAFATCKAVPEPGLCLLPNSRLHVPSDFFDIHPIPATYPKKG